MLDCKLGIECNRGSVSNEKIFELSSKMREVDHINQLCIIIVIIVLSIFITHGNLGHLASRAGVARVWDGMAQIQDILEYPGQVATLNSSK